MQFPFDPRPPKNCAECGFLGACGGLDGEASSRGCFQRCASYCQHKGCDLACPCLHLSFPDLVEDVNGLCSPPNIRLLPASGPLPTYLPQINHGCMRHVSLEEEVVVIPLLALIRKDVRGRLDVRYSSPETLRKSLQLSRQTRILASGIAPDQPLEEFWAQHQRRELLSRLAGLELIGMTTPNFSFMLDVPRTNALYNLTRIFRMAERISQAGIPAIFHLQATTKRDWKRWAEVLQDQPDASLVALEFQTGASLPEIGNPYYLGLVELQHALNRPIHPLVFAGAARIRQLAKDFDSFTIVDSTPFLKTVHRQALLRLSQNRWLWRPQPTAPGQSLHALLVSNIASHRDRLLEASAPTPIHPEDAVDPVRAVNYSASACTLGRILTKTS